MIPWNKVAEEKVHWWKIARGVRRHTEVVTYRRKQKVYLSSMRKQYLHQFKGETLMEDAVDPSSSRQLIGVNLVSRAFNAFLKVHSKLLDHPERKPRAWSRTVHWAVLSREGHWGHSLKQSFGLASRVIRAKVLVLLHLLLNGEELALELVPQPWQSVTDVIGQLLHKKKV